MTDDRDALLEREMGYSLDEFNRVLPAAMRDWEVSGSAHSWQVNDVDGAHIAELRLRPQAARSIGSLQLPVLLVTIDLRSASGERRAEFLRRFERGFHRGGG